MASVSEQLLAALDDLDADELKRFKWRFKNHYCVSSAALDKADPPDTVDLMMKRFGPEEAVKIMVEILRKMNQNHVADKLEDRHKQAQAEASVEDPALVGAESEPIGDRKIVPDWDNMRINLKVTQRSFKQRIQQREKDLQQLKEAVESYKRSAQTAVEESERIFTELIRSIERSSSEVTQRIRDQEQAALSRAEVGLEQLEQEINDLRMRDAELEQLSHTQDHIQFRQSFQSLSAPPESTEVPKIPFSSLFSFDGLRESVRQLGEKLEDFCKEEIKKISDRVTFTNIVSKTRNDLLQYYHQLTLDPNTMNRQLVLSEKNSVITHTNRDQPYPDHPDRFHNGLQVLCRESVCGRSYWEIEWSGQVYIAVSYKSISRKGQYNECRFGSNDQSWSLDCFDYSYSFRHNNIETKLTVKSISSRTGVCVDPSAGTLSFYSVDRDTMILIHTVQTTFTQPLYPGFWVGSVSSVKLC
ncbi:tripartite motif-containing protein 16-like protein isoform X1 [Pimephales promelas]|uniref:tripartite motif-containing protein 16-like protein isoform X1 n=1 Tax=Pimephales promelas TaxID=90988 RepID=UPI001955AB55|nr:tripartite motif-containing protein 16-like protein isoform X1 [Pimephales promelas]